jgi:hypothetical protein
MTTPVRHSPIRGPQHLFGGHLHTPSGNFLFIVLYHRPQQGSYSYNKIHGFDLPIFHPAGS